MREGGQTLPQTVRRCYLVKNLSRALLQSLALPLVISRVGFFLWNFRRGANHLPKLQGCGELVFVLCCCFLFFILFSLSFFFSLFFVLGGGESFFRKFVFSFSNKQLGMRSFLRKT